MLVYCTWLTPELNLPVPNYTPGWREALQRELNVLPKSTIQFPQTGLQPEALNPEMSTQTMSVV